MAASDIDPGPETGGEDVAGGSAPIPDTLPLTDPARFSEQRRHPVALLLVVAVHALFGALLLTSSYVQEVIPLPQALKVLNVQPEQKPPPPPPPEPPQVVQPLAEPPIVSPKSIVKTPTPPPLVRTTANLKPVKVALAAPADPAPSAPPAPPAPVTPPNFNAAQLGNPAPAYPYLSRKAREEGVVMLRVLVTPAGRAGEVRIEESSGFHRLDQAAKSTVKRWRFVPAQQAGSPVAAWVLVPITFALG